MLFFSYFSAIANHVVKLENRNCPVVISVPPVTNQKVRRQIFDAAQSAGFQVLQIISNPAAACLAYDLLNNFSNTIHVLVYHIGGISTNVSLLRILPNGLLSILHNICENDLGGKQFSEILVKFIANEFYQKYKLDPQESRKTMSKLFQYAENTKHVLSSMQTAHIFIESLMDGVDFSYNLSRARYESLFANLIPIYRKPVEKVLSESGFTGQIDKIILCGGGMRIPKMKSEIGAMFPNAEVLSGINEDEVLAIGCAKQASITTKQWDIHQEFLDMEVKTLPVDIVIKTNNNTKEIEIFKAGCTVPCYTKFCVSLGGMTIIDIYEKKSLNDLTFIGQTKLKDQIDDLREIELCAKLDMNGIEINFV